MNFLCSSQCLLLHTIGYFQRGVFASLPVRLDTPSRLPATSLATKTRPPPLRTSALLSLLWRTDAIILKSANVRRRRHNVAFVLYPVQPVNENWKRLRVLLSLLTTLHKWVAAAQDFALAKWLRRKVKGLVCSLIGFLFKCLVFLLLTR